MQAGDLMGVENDVRLAAGSPYLALARSIQHSFNRQARDVDNWQGTGRH